jgi:hypothetical protein
MRYDPEVAPDPSRWLELGEDERIMLAYAWDGLPLTRDHGFPLRIYIPDVHGMKQPKWITGMEFVNNDPGGYWVRRGWDAQALANTTSVIDTVAVDDRVENAAGEAVIPVGGIAWAGDRGISRVEVRVDDLPKLGEVLDYLDELGITDDTFVMYSTDNGPHMNSWPDAGMTPFRSEKNSNWEGAYRVPAMVRWPGKIKPGQISNEMVAHHDWLPTLLAIAGDTQVKEKLLKGHKVGDMNYKVHLDGDNLVPYLTGQAQKSPRESFLYFSDEQQLVAMRYDNWKLVFMEQQTPGTMFIWANPFTSLRLPKMYNLRTDPYERADITSNTYYDWVMDHAFQLVPVQAFVGQFLATFKEYPQRQKAASFNLDKVMEKLQENHGSK